MKRYTKNTQNSCVTDCSKKTVFFSFLVKILCTLLVVVSCSTQVNAQTVNANYLQTRKSTTYVAIGASASLSAFPANFDGSSATYAPVNASIGFTFNFKGTVF